MDLRVPPDEVEQVVVVADVLGHVPGPRRHRVPVRRPRVLAFEQPYGDGHQEPGVVVALVLVVIEHRRVRGAVPHRDRHALDELGHRAPRPVIPGQEPPRLHVEPRIILRYVHSHVPEGRGVPVLHVVFLQPEGVLRVPLLHHAARRTQEEPPVEDGHGHLAVEARVHELEDACRDPPVHLVRTLDHLVGHEPAQGHVLLLVQGDIAAHRDGQRLVDRRDVVHRVALEPGHERRALPWMHARPHLQADAGLEEPGRVVEEGLHGGHEAPPHVLPVHPRGIEVFIHIGFHPGQEDELVRGEPLLAPVPDVGARRREPRHGDAPLGERDGDGPDVLGRQLVHETHDHAHGTGGEEPVVVGRLDPQVGAFKGHADVRKARSGERRGQPLLQGGEPQGGLLPVGRIVDGDELFADVEVQGHGDAELLAPLPAEVDLGPVQRLQAHAHVDL